MSDLAVAAHAFRTAASPLGVRLAANTATFRPLLMPSQPEPAFTAAGAGAGGPVADMVGRLRTVFEMPDEAAPPAQEPLAAADPAAVSEADLTRARDEAFAAGVEEGRRAAQEAYGLKLVQFDRLLADLSAARASDPADLEPLLADAALHLVTETLEADPDLARDTIAPRVHSAAARLAERAGAARLRLNPADHQALARCATWPANIAAEADPAIAPGGFALSAGDSLIEDRIADRLAHAAAALTRP